MLHAFKTLGKVLFERFDMDDIRAFTKADLVLGLAFTWAVGMGRYWDDPIAEDFQYLGAGSIIYVFALSFLLWLVGLPLKIERWRYFYLLTFVTLTSPPGLLYAIPVERFTNVQTAMELNLGFLALVALWRLSLLFTFFRRCAGFTSIQTAIVALFPIGVIMFLLAITGVQRTVLRGMAGLPANGPLETSANDATAGAVFALGILSLYATPIIFFSYLYLVRVRRRLNHALQVPPNTPEPTPR